jgi:hypothetical protein
VHEITIPGGTQTGRVEEIGVFERGVQVCDGGVRVNDSDGSALEEGHDSGGGVDV